jgi:hypothetical protein
MERTQCCDGPNSFSFLRCLCPLDNFVEMESGDRRFGYLGDWWSYRLRMATGGLRCSGLNRG